MAIHRIKPAASRLRHSASHRTQAAAQAERRREKLAPMLVIARRSPKFTDIASCGDYARDASKQLREWVRTHSRNWETVGSRVRDDIATGGKHWVMALSVTGNPVLPTVHHDWHIEQATASDAAHLGLTHGYRTKG